MLFTATPEPDHSPPRVRLDIDVEDPLGVINYASVFRNEKLIRFQPSAGSNTATVYDYEAPYGEEVQYEALVNFEDTSLTKVFEEKWNDLSQWSGATANWRVSPANDIAYTWTNGSTIEAPIASGIVEMKFSSAIGLSYNNPRYVYISIRDAANVEILFVAWLTFYNGFRIKSPLQEATQISGNTPATLVLNPETGKATWTSQSGVLEINYDPTKIPDHLEMLFQQAPSPPVAPDVLPSPGVNGNASIGAIEAWEKTGIQTILQKTTTTLAPSNLWMINPINPDQSLQLDNGMLECEPTGLSINPATSQTKTYKARQSVFYPSGRSRAVTLALGNRLDEEWELQLDTKTLTDRNALQRSLDDQIPFLIQVPTNLKNLDIPEGWFAVGALTEQRKALDLTQPYRTFTLPMSPVKEPTFIEVSDWRWSTMLRQHISWGEVVGVYPTWQDVVDGG